MRQPGHEAAVHRDADRECDEGPALLRQADEEHETAGRHTSPLLRTVLDPVGRARREGSRIRYLNDQFLNVLKLIIGCSQLR